MIEFSSLQSFQRADAGARSQILAEGRFAVAGREFLVQADQQTIRQATPEAAAFHQGASSALDGRGQSWLPQLQSALFPQPSQLAGRLEANLSALPLTLLKPDDQAFLASTGRKFAGISIDRPSQALSQVRDAFQSVIARADESSLRQLDQSLERWQQDKPKEFANRGQHAAGLRREIAQVISHLQAERAKAAGLHGISLPPAVASQFADKVAFDGIGRVMGLKTELGAGEIEQLQNRQTTSLTRLNAAGERTAPKTENASLVAFVDALRQDGGATALSLADRAQGLWLSGQVNTQQSIELYQDAVRQLSGQPHLAGLAESLLADAGKEKTTGQYLDNLFGRYFDSEFAHALVERPSDAALSTSAQIGDALVKAFDSYFEQLPINDADRAKRLDSKMEAFAKAISKDTRPWFSEVPELTRFLAQPSHANFQAMMGKVDNGFDMIKVPFLAVKMAITEGMGLNMADWKRAGDRFYTDHITKARSTSEVVSENEDRSIKVTLKEQQTRGYGTLLPHQQVEQQRHDGFLSGRNVAAGRILTPGKETAFERNALSQGQSVVTGASGSTNIMVHLNQHLAGELDGFSPEQAYLNTLAFLVFDGGHSVNESLSVYQALAETGDKRAEVLQNYTADYRDLIKLAPAGSQESVEQALAAAFDKTVDLNRQLQS
ncbi:RTX toxin [Chromobacterium phragmitis]|uniref:RTX toxin n=1 Tax=Chromobacterium phragmitis TaxID=2202141 RepID=A0A344UMD1_9NEIS|nr:RTX toxin [Chromobacterium phragmitis]AXE36429.1 RTX toxin [Chromobacterium phragmitis]